MMIAAKIVVRKSFVGARHAIHRNL